MIIGKFKDLLSLRAHFLRAPALPYLLMIFTICLPPSIFAQSIRVEESTAPLTQQTADEPIEINISGTTESGVSLTTVGEEDSSGANDSNNGNIDLRPDAFKDPAVPTFADDDASTESGESESSSDAPTEAPSGIPAPTSNPVGPNEQNESESAEPAKPEVPGESAPIDVPDTDDEVTSAPPGIEEDFDDVGPSSPGAMTGDRPVPPYLPPADLGDKSFTMRSGERIPLRPELLSSVTLNVTVPDVYHTTLTNGLRFYHYESRDLPRVRVSLLIEAGKNAAPADKVGLAVLTARTMRAGGAGGKSGDEIDRRLEHIGSDLEFKVESDNVAGSLFALTDKAEEAMAILADILIRPDFNPQKFQQQRERMFEELRRQNDQPSDISRREFSKIIYGPEHPLARTPTSATISSITIDDVRAFHDARYRPSTVWVGVSGDISRDDARKLVETAFGDWNRPEAEDVVVPPVDENRLSTGGVYLTRKATAQSQIRMGHFGITRRSPKAYAVNVLNSIYGMGGFSSRLMNVVRTKHGFVYGVGGGIMSDDPVGMFIAAAASKAGTTAAAIEAMLNVTRGMIEGPISETEVETARRDVVFTFVNQFDTPAETVGTHMIYDYRGYAPNYLKTFPENVREVTVEDVKRVARELFHPDRIKIYVIGNESEMDAPLSKFGPVQNWILKDYSGD